MLEVDVSSLGPMPARRLERGERKRTHEIGYSGRQGKARWTERGRMLAEWGVDYCNKQMRNTKGAVKANTGISTEFRLDPASSGEPREPGRLKEEEDDRGTPAWRLLSG